MATTPARTIKDHATDPANEKIAITTMDAPGIGGANHEYLVAVPEWNHVLASIRFQNGPIKDANINGLTHEILIAICIDRLRSFQEGPYRCRENAVALTKLEEAMMWLHKRTRAREARGVEGTHTV